MPFIFRGREVYGCISERGEREWCATSIDSLSNPVTSDLCPENWGKYPVI